MELSLIPCFSTWGPWTSKGSWYICRCSLYLSKSLLFLLSCLSHPWLGRCRGPQCWYKICSVQDPKRLKTTILIGGQAETETGSHTFSLRLKTSTAATACDNIKVDCVPVHLLPPMSLFPFYKGADDHRTFVHLMLLFLYIGQSYHTVLMWLNKVDPNGTKVNIKRS